LRWIKAHPLRLGNSSFQRSISIAAAAGAWGTAMIGTNRDLTAMRELIDGEIRRFDAMAKAAPGQYWIQKQLLALCRQRLAVCAALVNRRAEAGKSVVDFTRWMSGNGALGEPSSWWASKQQITAADDARP
jgi:hypothetical protein